MITGPFCLPRRYLAGKLSRLLIFLLGCSVGQAAGAQFSSQEPAPDFSGHWEGHIDTPGMALDVLVDLHCEDGIWSGTADIPMQGAKGLPLAGIRVEGDQIEFGMANIPGDPTFRGKLEQGRLSGTFTQGGQGFPFALGREAIAPPARPQEPDTTQLPYGPEEVTFSHDDVQLAGTLTLPAGTGPYPAALLVSGSGPQDRNEEVFGHKPFLVLADHLTRAGIAVLRVDDRGVGGSTGSVTQATSEDLAADAEAGVAFLRQHPEIDARRVGLIGHSEGGLIAPMVATRSKGVAFVVLLAGPGVPGDQLLARQTELLARAAGMDGKPLSRMLAAHHRLIELVEAGAAEDSLREQAERLITAQADSEAANTNAAGLEEAAARVVKQLDSPWFRFFLRYDPRTALRRLQVPVLALDGSLDLQVDPAQNLPEIRKALAQARNRDATVMELPGLNHLFQKAKTGSVQEYYTIEETMDPAALDTIRDWILARFGNR
jgi:pimeloyl-ACP methyl ester carboxylesterase